MAAGILLKTAGEAAVIDCLYLLLNMSSATTYGHNIKYGVSNC